MHEVLKTDVKEKETKVLESNKVLSAKRIR